MNSIFRQISTRWQSALALSIIGLIWAVLVLFLIESTVGAPRFDRALIEDILRSIAVAYWRIFVSKLLECGQLWAIAILTMLATGILCIAFRENAMNSTLADADKLIVLSLTIGGFMAVTNVPLGSVTPGIRLTVLCSILVWSAIKLLEMATKSSGRIGQFWQRVAVVAAVIILSITCAIPIDATIREVFG